MTEPAAGPPSPGPAPGDPTVPGAETIVDARGLAALFGVTPATVRNWRDRGMGTDGDRERPGGHGPGRVEVYRLSRCLDWHRRNINPDGPGGKRESAGRKSPRAQGGDPPLNPPETEIRRPPTIGPPADPERESLKRRALDGDPSVGTLTDVHGRVQFTRQEAETLDTVLTAELRRLDLLQRRGELVRASEVRDTWAAFLTSLRARMGGMPQRGAARLLAALELPPETMQRVAAVIAELVAEFDRDLVDEVSEAAAA